MWKSIVDSRRKRCVACCFLISLSSVCFAFQGASPLVIPKTQYISKVNYAKIQPKNFLSASSSNRCKYERFHSLQAESLPEKPRDRINLRELFVASLGGARAALTQGWWCLPMLLTLVPVYCALVLGTTASMPDFWQCIKWEDLHLGLTPFTKKLMVRVFLLSNLSYFVTGFYFWSIFPRISPKAKRTLRKLGSWILVAGAISTIFHSVQALGPHVIAESLCYVDHGVAMSAVFYFWVKCGPPSRATQILSALGFASLAVSGPVYPWLHSVWHLLSSVAAFVWVRDGLAKPHSQD